MCWGLRGAVVVGVYQRYANGKGINELEEPGGGGVAAGKRGEERGRKLQITRPQVWQYTDPGTGAGAGACREGRVGIWGVVEMGRRWG